MSAAHDRWECLDVDVLGDAGTSPSGVLYLHGWDEDKASLVEFAEATLPAAGHALLPTLRGHGHGPRPATGYAPADFAADLQRTFWDRPPLQVVGYSYGALVALSYAVNVGPHRVPSVTLLDQALFADISRRVGGEWAEASAMKWEFDYTHQVRAAVAVGIDVLLVVAEESSVVGPAERDFWLDQPADGLRVCRVPGDHRGLVRGPAHAVAVTRQFLSEAHDRMAR
ncbi:MAG: alpha/beta hydrolase [Actinomycetota bacterium]|nr:alpha/beta hydrolase [Actinomycetota bacterium]